MADAPDAGTSDTTNPDTLNGWKEIAQYLGKSTRTVQRWERNYGLPVQRIAAARGEVIWASRAEVDRWRTERPSLSEDEPGGVAAVTPAEPAMAAPARRATGRTFATLAAVALLPILVAGYWWQSGQDALLFETTGPATRPQGETFPLRLGGLAPKQMATRWTRVPNGNTERLGAPITAGTDGRILWALTTDCRTETGTHRLWMVDDASGHTSNTVTLVVLPNPVCDQPNPDLAVRGVKLDRARVRAGESVGVSYTLWNLGTASAVPTTTRLRLGRESSRSRVTDLKLGDHSAPELAMESHASQRTTVRIPANTPPGVYYVWVVADNESLTIEPNSFNNFSRSQALVVVSP